MPSFDDLAADPGIKSFHDGTHRLVSPQATLDRVQPHLASMGITRIANVTGLDRIGVPVVMVIRPNARSLAVAQGKGLTLEAAKTSGVMEAIEIHHAERIPHPLQLASTAEIAARHDIIDIARLPPINSSRYHPDLPMLWIEGLDLLSNRACWLPFETVHTNFTLPLPPGSGCFAAGTNGLASGNHPFEALGHALTEVIERDAATLWRQGGTSAQRASRVDPDSLTDPDARKVLDRIGAAGLETAIFETSSDVGVPAFQCVIVDRDDPLAHPGLGNGCHLSPEIALLRALTEAVQVRMTYITGARDDLCRDEFTDEGREKKRRVLDRWLRSPPERRFEDAVRPPLQESFKADLELLLDRLRAVGITHVIAVDLTDSAYGLPVFKVVVPGLEGLSDDEDYLPGARAGALLAAAS